MGTLTDDTSTLGTADLGTQGMSLSDQGLSATPPVGAAVTPAPASPG